MIIFIKLRIAGANLFHADLQADGHMNRSNEANSRFPQFRECA